MGGRGRSWEVKEEPQGRSRKSWEQGRHRVRARAAAHELHHVAAAVDGRRDVGHLLGVAGHAEDAHLQRDEGERGCGWHERRLTARLVPGGESSGAHLLELLTVVCDQPRAKLTHDRGHAVARVGPLDERREHAAEDLRRSREVGVAVEIVEVEVAAEIDRRSFTATAAMPAPLFLFLRLKYLKSGGRSWRDRGELVRGAARSHEIRRGARLEERPAVAPDCLAARAEAEAEAEAAARHLVGVKVVRDPRPVDSDLRFGRRVRLHRGKGEGGTEGGVGWRGATGGDGGR